MEIVSKVRAQLISQLGEERYELWFGTGTRLRCDGGTLSVLVDTRFRLDRLRKNHHQDIQKVATDVLGEDSQVAFLIDQGLFDLDGTEAAEAIVPPAPTAPTPALLATTVMTAAAPAAAPSAPAAELLATADSTAISPQLVHRWHGAQPPADQPVAGRIRPKSAEAAAPHARRFASLGSFVVGGSNQLAFNALKMVLDNPGQMNPLLLHGPPGVGKTHLLEGAWSTVRARGGRRVVYLTAEQFTIYFLQALRGSGLPVFRQKYREMDLLILDDIQFFMGKQATISELLHTLDALVRQGRQVLLASDRGPGDLQQLGNEMRTRILGGCTCALQPLDDATRHQLAIRLLEQRQLTLADGLVERIVLRTPGDARQLSGVVNRLWATSRALQRSVSMSMVEEVLDEYFPNSGGVIRLDDVQRVICAEFNLDPQVLRSDRKTHDVSHPRMLAMWLARKLTGAALTEICEFFGRRSHSTVLAAQNKVEQWVQDGRQMNLGHRSCDVQTVLTRLERSLRA